MVYQNQKKSMIIVLFFSVLFYWRKDCRGGAGIGGLRVYVKQISISKSVIRKVYYEMYVLCSIEINL